jgi:nicotinamide-nucleotide adenylyltransferase
VHPDVFTSALDRMKEVGPPRLEVFPPTESGRAAAIGLIPGSFDPMTVGHAALADALRREGSELVLFVYSPATLPKQGGPDGAVRPALLQPEERLPSLMAFCEPREGLGVAICSHGLYVDQAEAARTVFPRSELVLGMGSDKLIQLFDPVWYEDRDAALDRLISLARVVYAMRAGDEERLAGVLSRFRRYRNRLKRIPLPNDIAGVASRTVREAVARGEDVAPLVPSEVLPFVRAASPR